MLKLAVTNPLQAATAMDTLQRGDEVHPPMIANPYQLDPEAAAQYENGYQYAQKIGHLQLISVPPEQLLGQTNGSVPWREGFAASARALGAGQVADTIEATIAPKTAGIPMDLTKLAYGYMQGLRYGAGIGAGLGAIKGLATGESFSDVAKDTLSGAAAGGALGSLSSPLVNKARGWFAPKVNAPLPAAPAPVAQHPAPTSIPDSPVLDAGGSADVMPIQPRFKTSAGPLGPIDPLARMPAHFFAPGASLAPRKPVAAAPGSLPHADVQHLLSQVPATAPATQPRFGVSMDPPMLGLSKIALIRPVGIPGMTASFNRFAGQPASKPRNIKPVMAPAAAPQAAGISFPNGKQSVPVHDVMQPGMPEVGRKVAEMIPGGKADGRDPSSFDPQQLEMGIKVEMEHTDDRAAATEIAMDHLSERPDYYTVLTAAGLNDEAKAAEAKPEGFFHALKDELGKAKDKLVEHSKAKGRSKDRLFRAAFGMKPREEKKAGCGDAPRPDYKAKLKALAERRGEPASKYLPEEKTAVFVPMEKGAGGTWNRVAPLITTGGVPGAFGYQSGIDDMTRGRRDITAEDRQRIEGGFFHPMVRNIPTAVAGIGSTLAGGVLGAEMMDNPVEGAIAGGLGGAVAGIPLQYAVSRGMGQEHALAQMRQMGIPSTAPKVAEVISADCPIFVPMEKEGGMLGNVLGGAGIGAALPVLAGAATGGALGAGADLVGLDHVPVIGHAADPAVGAVAGGLGGAMFAPMGAAVGSVAGAGKSVYDATKPKPVPAFATVN